MATRKQYRRKRAAQRATPRRRAAGERHEELELPPATTAAREPSVAWTRIRSAAASLVSRPAFPPLVLTLLFVVSAVVLSLLARNQAIPTIGPDEFFYGKLAQGLAWGDGLKWHGSGYGLPPLWPTVLSLAWLHGSAGDGYATAKTLGAILVSTTVFPVWYLAKSFVGPRLALVPAALAVTGVWMQVSDFMLSENLAYPLSAWALAMTVMAVRDTRMRWIAASLGFAALAALTRTQMLVLPVILVLALILDVVRQPRNERRARIDARPRALWITLIAVVALGLLAFVVKPDLTNYDVLTHGPSLGQILSAMAHEGVGSIAYFAFVPVVATLALMVRKANWRDENVGALLVTLTAAIIVIYPLCGRFLAWATAGVTVDRYAIALVPLLLTALMVAPGRVGRRSTVAVAIGVALTMFAAPKIVNFVEQGGVYGIQKALLDNGVAFGHLKAGVIVVGLSISLLSALALSSRRHPGRGLAFACLLCAALMVGQNWAARSYEYSASRLTRIQFVPTRADWVDHYATGPVATLDVGKNLPLRANSVIFTEFFNKKIKAYYSTIATGNGCDIDLAKDGTAKHGDDKCKVWPRNWVLADGPVATTLKGQKVLARTTRSGVLVATPPGPPRVLSLVAAPCTVYGCTGEFRLGTYLDKPSEVSVRFGPGSVDHRVQLGTTKVQTLPAGEPVNLHFNLPAGPQAATLPVDWSDPDGAPRLEAVAIKTADGKTYRVY